MLKIEHPHLFFLQYEMENIWGESNFFKHHNVGTCLRHVSTQSTMYQRLGNMPKAKALKKSKRGILEPLETAYCG